MTYRIVWEPEATSAAVRFLKEDPRGLAALYEAVDALAEDPRPAHSSPYGSSYRRLRAGSHRALYIVDEDVIRILVTQLGRTSGWSGAGPRALPVAAAAPPLGLSGEYH